MANGEFYYQEKAHSLVRGVLALMKSIKNESETLATSNTQRVLFIKGDINWIFKYTISVQVENIRGSRV